MPCAVDVVSLMFPMLLLLLLAPYIVPSSLYDVVVTSSGSCTDTETGKHVSCAVGYDFGRPNSVEILGKKD